MRRPAALLTQRRRLMMVFVAAELLLAMAIPFVAIEGYYTLLESRAGKFVEEPGRDDPGWRALVDSTAVVAIVEVDDPWGPEVVAPSDGAPIEPTEVAAASADVATTSAANDIGAGADTDAPLDASLGVDGSTGVGGAVDVATDSEQVVDSVVPTPVAPDAETVDPAGGEPGAVVSAGVVTGITLLIHHPEVRSAGTVILVPGTLELEGVPLAARSPADAVDALARTMRLSIGQVEVMDGPGWRALLGADTYVLESPDPVLGAGGELLFEVGTVEVDADNVSAFVGRPAPGASAVSIQPRRHIFWNAIVAAPPSGATPLAVDLRTMQGGPYQILDLPVTQLEPVAVPDVVALESVIRDVVAYPAGAALGDRLQVRIVDRAGGADLERIAAAMAARGMEVLEIGNALVFDAGPTEVIAPVALVADDGGLPPALGELTQAAGADTVTIDGDAIEEFVVTLVVGADFDLANLR